MENKFFELTDANKKAIEIFEIAGYKIQFGQTVFSNGTTTFDIYQDNKKVHGCSPSMLTPAFAIAIIQNNAYKFGKASGIKYVQDKFNKLFNI